MKIKKQNGFKKGKMEETQKRNEMKRKEGRNTKKSKNVYKPEIKRSEFK